MRTHRWVAFLVGVGVAAGIAPCATYGAESLAECAQVPDDASRLACYDRLAGRTKSGSAQPVTAPAAAVAAPASGPGAASPAVTAVGATAVVAAPGPAAAVPATATVTGSTAAKDPVADFGLSQQTIKERDPTGWVESVSSTVGSVGQNAAGRYVVTLENGQVWTQTETNSYPVVRPGDAVTIKRAALGSFVLSGPRSVSWRVRRVR